MGKPSTFVVDEADYYSKLHPDSSWGEPLPETVHADSSIAQVLLGRGTHNTPELRAGMYAALRAQLAEHGVQPMPELERVRRDEAAAKAKANKWMADSSWWLPGLETWWKP